jgi:hypothetical protein
MTWERKPGDRLLVKCEVKSIAPDVGRGGQPQWKVEALLPWTDFVAKFWIDASAGNQPEKGTYEALMERGQLNQGRDGSVEWHWKWRIIELHSPSPHSEGGNVTEWVDVPIADSIPPGEAPSRETPPTAQRWAEESMKADHPSKRRSIERQSAGHGMLETRMGCIREAVALAIGNGDTDQMNTEAIVFEADRLFAWALSLEEAERYYDWIAASIGSAGTPVVAAEPESPDVDW